MMKKTILAICVVAGLMLAATAPAAQSYTLIDLGALPIGNVSRACSINNSGQVVGDGRVYYVSTTGSDANPGTQTEPFATLSHAIDVAEAGDEIRVAEGFYPENVTMKDGVDLLGGWSPNFSRRDFVTHISVIDGGGGGSVVSFVDATAELNGFTIQNGIGTPVFMAAADNFGVEATYHYGGGIYVLRSSPLIINNIIADNTASIGGGIYVGSGSEPDIACNTITRNIANNDTAVAMHGEPRAGSTGGGIALYNHLDPDEEPVGEWLDGEYPSWTYPTIRRNIITENEARANVVPDLGFEKLNVGGGISINYTSPLIINNEIANNTATLDGKDDQQDSTVVAGGIALTRSGAVITHNFIHHNRGEQRASGDGKWWHAPGVAGGIGNHYSGDQPELIKFTPEGKVLIDFNIITHNTAFNEKGWVRAGGGIAAGSQFAESEIRDNLIAYNRADRDSTGGGIVFYGRAGYHRVVGNIISYNEATNTRTRWSNTAGGIYVAEATAADIWNNIFAHNRATSTVYNKGTGGAITQSGWYNGIRLVNNTIYENFAQGGQYTAGGYCQGQTGNTLTNANNIFFNNECGDPVYPVNPDKHHDIRTYRPWNARQTIRHNIVTQQTIFGAGPGNIVLPPGTPATDVMVDPDAGDFFPAVGSPAMDAATDTLYAFYGIYGAGTWDVPDFDFEGNPRPVGSAKDIGAYEWTLDRQEKTPPGMQGPAGPGSCRPPTISITIDIKPGSDPNSINTKSKGVIPVAILSTEDFDALDEVNQESLTFGPTGDEESLAFCTKSAEDVNGDGLPDQVCHFNTPDTRFQQGDSEGILKGQTVDGVSIEGRDTVNIVPKGK